MTLFWLKGLRDTKEELQVPALTLMWKNESLHSTAQHSIALDPCDTHTEAHTF